MATECMLIQECKKICEKISGFWVDFEQQS